MGNSRLVYCSDGGRVRTAGARPRSSEQSGSPGPDDGVVRLFRERSGRGGKVVTVIRGLPGRGPDLAALSGELKRLCGAGGTVKDGTVEIQGDHRDRVAEVLRGRGHRVKLAGG